MQISEKSHESSTQHPSQSKTIKVPESVVSYAHEGIAGLKRVGHRAEKVVRAGAQVTWDGLRSQSLRLRMRRRYLSLGRAVHRLHRQSDDRSPFADYRELMQELDQLDAMQAELEESPAHGSATRDGVSAEKGVR